MQITTDKNDIKTMTANIIKYTRSYLEFNDIKTVVVGLSGGIDSTLAAVLARTAIERASVSIKLIGRSLPIVSNLQGETDRAEDIGKLICHEYETKNLSLLYRLVASIVAPKAFFNIKRTYDQKIRLGNIKARLRMIYLYNLARKHNGIVLSTDNYTEYLLGFWTLHGDVGDFGPIQSLWKTEVYAMAADLRNTLDNLKNTKTYGSSPAAVESASRMSMAIQRSILAVPTDGLGITKSDFEQLGVESYEEIDMVLSKMMSNYDDIPASVVEEAIYDRCVKTQFKRRNPLNIPRKEIMEDIECGG